MNIHEKRYLAGQLISMPPKDSSKDSGIGKANLRSSTSTSEARGDTDVLLEALVKIQESINNANNSQQQTLNLMLQKIDAISESHSTLHNDVHGNGGLKQQVNELQENLGNQIDTVEELRQENAMLKKELNTVKSLLIHTTQRVDRNEAQITSLKTKSLSANILIHNIPEKKGEDLNSVLSEKFANDLSISNVKFTSIYRLGASPPSGTKPRIVCAQLANPSVKPKLLSAARGADELGFNITNQLPEEVRDARSRLYQVRDFYEAKKVKCDVKGDKLVFKETGSVYREKVTLPTAERLLTAFSEPGMAKKLDELHTVTGQVFTHKGNTIVSHAADIECYKDINLFSLKVLSLNNTVPATSNVLVYSFIDRDGEVHEGYCNDREFGAGQSILKKMNEKGYQNKVFIMSRKVGEHLGAKRFSIFDDNANSALELLSG